MATRAHRASHEAIAQLLGMPVVSLELVDPYFYHLDTCFAPLGPGRVMYYPPAFAGASRLLIEERFPERIAVRPEEAQRFICNAVVIGETVVSVDGCPEARAALEHWGYRVLTVGTSEFIKAGGSAKCMVLFLERGAAVE